MSAAKMVALFLFLVSIILFLLVGFDIVKTTDYNLVALGLASYVIGFVLDKYVP